MKIDIYPDRKNITLAFLVAAATYVVGMCILTIIYQCRFDQVIIFNPEIPSACGWLAAIVSTFVFFSGFILLFFIPGCLLLLNFKNMKCDLPVFAGLSFAISIIGLILITTLFKVIWASFLDRLAILAGVALLACIGLAGLWLKSKATLRTVRWPIDRRRLLASVIFVMLVIIFSVSIKDKIISQELPKYDYTEEKVLSIPLGHQRDDLETFGLAHSLRSHLLPYWDLEYADRFGFVVTDPPLSRFLTMFAILLFGENTTSVALTSLGFITVTFLIILAKGNKNIYIRLLICSTLFFSYLNLFRDSEYLFILQNHFFSFVIFVSYVYLIRKDYQMFLTFAVIALLSRYYGLLFSLLGFAGLAIFFAQSRQELRRLLLKYCLLAAGLFVLIAFGGVLSGDLFVYGKTILIEHFARLDHFALLSRAFPGEVIYNSMFSYRSFQFLAWSVYATGFTLPMVLFFGKDREENFYSFIAIFYLAAAFFSRYHLIKYVIPLIPLTAIVVSNKLERWVWK